MRLTKRETEIIEMLSYGFADKEIANELQISSRTVQTYIERLIIKLNARNRIAAVATYLKVVQ